MSKTKDEITVEAVIDNLEQVTTFVDSRLEALGCPADIQFQIDVAVEELYTNISNYAYAPETGSVTVRTEGETQSLYATVQEGPLVINVEEYGEIAPSEQITLKNEVQGRTSIITLVPEGKIVQEGEVLVQLDVSSKIDEKDSQEITLRNAESALEVAREALDIQQNQSESDVELAEQDYEFAKEDLDKYENGDYPTKLIAQKGHLAISEQQVKQAKDKYEWSKKLFAEDFISET